MPVQSFFPTFVYASRLQRGASRELDRQLLKEGHQLREDDESGRRWSEKNYPGGYTSYGSAHRLQKLSPTFAELQRKIDPHVEIFAKTLDWDLKERALAMTDCWINIMTRSAAHGLHLHPLSAMSGTYYVRVPRGAPGIKLEDPRLERYMAAPPRKTNARQENRSWITLPARPGHLVMFESWLRHEVSPHAAEAERVSVSFNYSWF